MAKHKKPGPKPGKKKGKRGPGRPKGSKNAKPKAAAGHKARGGSTTTLTGIGDPSKKVERVSSAMLKAARKFGVNVVTFIFEPNTNKEGPAGAGEYIISLFASGRSDVVEKQVLLARENLDTAMVKAAEKAKADAEQEKIDAEAQAAAEAKAAEEAAKAETAEPEVEEEKGSVKELTEEELEAATSPAGSESKTPNGASPSPSASPAPSPTPPPSH